MDLAVIAALREGGPLPEARFEALHRSTTTVVRERWFVSNTDAEAFLAGGYTHRNVFEV